MATNRSLKISILSIGPMGGFTAHVVATCWSSSTLSLLHDTTRLQNRGSKKRPKHEHDHYGGPPHPVTVVKWESNRPLI